MKRNILIFGLFLMLANLFAQEKTSSRNVIGFGLSQMSYSTDPYFPIDITNGKYESIYIAYEWLHGKNFGFDLEVRKSISGDANLIDGRIKAGIIMNGRNRIQFPVFVGLGYYSIHEKDQAKYGSLLYTASAGVRFYITNKISIQGMYQFDYHSIISEDGETADELLGRITSKGIRIGLMYYLGS